MQSFEGMGIDFEEKAFYDILKALALAKAVKDTVDDKARYTDWS
jgi:type I restriction enzyme R subunit